MFWAEMWKISEFFYLKFFSFLWRWNCLYIWIGVFPWCIVWSCGCLLRGVFHVLSCLLSYCCVWWILSGVVITTLGTRALAALLFCGSWCACCQSGIVVLPPGVIGSYVLWLWLILAGHLLYFLFCACVRARVCCDNWCSKCMKSLRKPNNST